MRLGKWIRVFQNTIPIPLTFSASFGLREGSTLHLAAIAADPKTAGPDAEIIVSPIPPASWRSVCRLSVRLHDAPGALAKAAAFLRRRRINILLTEAAATFQERAHWDAVCDLIACPDYAPLRLLDYPAYEKGFRELLHHLSQELRHYAADPALNGEVFLSGVDEHAEFSVLTGLNIASFQIAATAGHRAPFTGGGIDLPDTLVREVRARLGSFGAMTAPIPSHALMTGNTEQRYLRLYFIRNVDEFVSAEIGCDLRGIAGDGIGVMSQVLGALPPALNLLHMGLYRGASHGEADLGTMRLIGHWPEPSQEQLKTALELLEIEDLDGVRHAGLCRLREFGTPRLVHPRVFVSFSGSVDAERLRILRNALSDHDFDPVLGTEVSDPRMLGGAPTSADVSSGAFEQIPTCVAFISLHSRRDDFRQHDGRCTVPPWIVAEEVFAYSRGVYLLARLRERGVEDPRYNKNTYEYEFDGLDDFRRKVTMLMHWLNEARQDMRFYNALKQARQHQFRRRPPPA